MATNQLYIKNGILPSLDDFDNRSLRSAYGNQEAPIPLVAQNGHYYLRVDGRKGMKDTQLVKLRAYVLPFSFRTVQAAKGGNTGFATVLLTGGRFDPNMTLFLEKDTVKIPVDSLGFVDGTKAYARFNLKDRPIGQYILRGQHPQGDTAAYRYYEVVAGGDPKIVTYLRHPQTAITRRGINQGIVKLFITLEFENQGTNDIPIPSQPVRSVADAPIALTSTDLVTSTATELLVPMHELEGPQTYLRAGAKGSILIWVNFSDKAMVYLVENNGDN